MKRQYPTFNEAALEVLDFTRCERPDGSFYGTGGQCRKGKETGEAEKPKRERGLSKVGLSSATKTTLSEPKNPPYKGKNAEVAKVTKELRDKYAKEEPKITGTMQDLAGKHGLQMVGLQARLKSEMSLGRKIESEKDHPDYGGSAKKAADDMSDVVRYTMRAQPGEYGSKVRKVIEDLQSQGYSARIKNYWTPGQPYRGMNVALTDPKGLKIELQFHTPDSLRVKDRIHKAYEKFRELPNTPQNLRARTRLWDQMVKISNQLNMPKGDVLSIGQIKQLKLETPES